MVLDDRTAETCKQPLQLGIEASALSSCNGSSSIHSSGWFNISHQCIGTANCDRNHSHSAPTKCFPHSGPENFSPCLFFWPFSLAECTREKQQTQFSLQNMHFWSDIVERRKWNGAFICTQHRWFMIDIFPYEVHWWQPLGSSCLLAVDGLFPQYYTNRLKCWG